MMPSRFITISWNFLKGIIHPIMKLCHHLLSQKLHGRWWKTQQGVKTSKTCNVFKCTVPLNTEGRHYVLDAGRYKIGCFLYKPSFVFKYIAVSLIEILIVFVTDKHCSEMLNYIICYLCNKKQIAPSKSLKAASPTLAHRSATSRGFRLWLC